jgi:dTDP-4-dehydrorhamnose reductase
LELVCDLVLGIWDFTVRILLTGASGQLGGYLLKELTTQAIETIAWSGSRRGSLFGIELRPVDLADADAVAAAFRAAQPDAVIHNAALARIADCFRDPERARRINRDATAHLAQLADETHARLFHVSTDLVFDGERGSYQEDDPPSPLSVYARSKADAEPAVLASPRGLVVRASLFFGPSVVGRPSFFDEQITALLSGKPIALFTDEWRTPLSLSTAAAALVEIAKSDLTGVLHLGGPDRLSRADMACKLAAFLGVSSSMIQSVSRNAVPTGEPRPRDTSLNSSRWRTLFPHSPWPTFDAALSGMDL